MIDDETLRTAVRAWLDTNWDAAAGRPRGGDADDVVAWNERLLEAGWLILRWSEAQGGRGFSEAQATIVEEAFRAVGAAGCGADRTNIGANTILNHGQPAVREALVRKLLTGEAQLCLLYSEPGAGSDLASLHANAERRGDHYVVNGQKVWTTGAKEADYGLLLARTDWTVPKHQGISFFLCPMKQPGVDIRPLHQITGESHFNEVFLEDTIIPADHLLGREGEGWKLLQSALAYERLAMGEGGTERRPDSPDANQADVVAFAREQNALADPVVRQQVAQAAAWRRLNLLNSQRGRAASSDGQIDGKTMTLVKLAMSRILHNDARVMLDVLGARAMLDGTSDAAAEDANYRALNAYINSIAGGTDQIQRNIIADRILGLPREVEVDRDLPFRRR